MLANSRHAQQEHASLELGLPDPLHHMLSMHANSTPSTAHSHHFTHMQACCGGVLRHTVRSASATRVLWLSTGSEPSSLGGTSAECSCIHILYPSNNLKQLVTAHVLLSWCSVYLCACSVRFVVLDILCSTTCVQTCCWLPVCVRWI